MTPRGAHLIAGALLAVMAPLSFAADIQPGLWELALGTRVAAAPDFSFMPFTVHQCLTAQDAQDPSGVLGSVTNPGATDCTYTEKSYEGGTFRFKMQCAGSFGIQARGEIAYTATTMEGNIVSTINMGGQPTELQSKIVARRLGGC